MALAAGMTRPNKSVSGIQIACFNLCQIIGMEIEERGRRIHSDGIFFPATHGQIKSTLETLKLFADKALAAIDVARADWNKEHPDDHEPSAD